MRLILCLFNDQGLGDTRARTKLTPTAGPQVPKSKRIKLPLNGDLTLLNPAVIYLFPIAVNLKSILFHF